MKRLGFKAILVGIAFVLSFAAMEICTRGFHLFSKSRQMLADSRPPSIEAVSLLPKIQIHPYVGWSERPFEESDYDAATVRAIFRDQPPSAWFLQNRDPNLLGFRSAIRDYREVPKDSLAIGIFGGSVARDLSTLGGDELGTTIRRLVPELKSSISILNFGVGAFKQPQQLNTLLEAEALGIRLDFVVNIDGANEIAFGGEDSDAGFHPYFPYRAYHLAVVSSANNLRNEDTTLLVAEIIRTRQLEQKVLSFYQSLAFVKWSHLVQAATGMIIERLHNSFISLQTQLQRQAESPAESRKFPVLPDPCLGRPGQCYELIASIWRSASVSMNVLSRQMGARYLHVLQPNQHVAGTTKTPTSEELQLVFGPQDAGSALIKKQIGAGYGYLQLSGSELRGQGVEFQDLTAVFASSSSTTVYRDHCCHLTREGNRVLARAVGELVAKQLQQGRRSPEAGTAIPSNPKGSR